MRTLSTSLAKLGSGAFLLLTSVYCLLAYIPYTYLFLVKEPPMHWLVVFISRHAALYWIFFGAALYGYWSGRKSHWVRASLALQCLMGVFFTARHYVPTIGNDAGALVASFAALAPVLIAGIGDILGHRSEEDDRAAGGMFPFSTAVLASSAITLISVAGSFWSGGLRSTISSVPSSVAELAVCVLATHVWLAVAATFAVNFVLFLLRGKTGTRRALRTLAVNGLLSVALFAAIVAFLKNSLTFQGWVPYVYAAALAATITVLGYTVFLPALFSRGPETPVRRFHRSGRIFVYAIALVAAIYTIASPGALGDADWNGVIQGSMCLLLWVFVTLTVFLLRPRLRDYPWPQLLAVALVTGSIYWGTIASAFLWAKDLGTTQGAVSRSIDSYASDNPSFSFARHMVAAANPVEPCGDVCQTLRQYSNIRNAQAPFEVNLVDKLERSPGRPPDIYLIVIDSARSDFFGAYNPSVTFTPNLDSFARDSFVIRRAYTQYAGTTLSEAALWTGALVLHAHYMRPFNRVNNLEKLLKTENYQLAVSYDSILRQILPDNNDLIKFDLNKPWNEFSIAASLEQLETFMEGPRRDKSRPLFFFAQPLNVHQFYGDKRAGGEAAPWQPPAGFHSRIAYRMHEVDQAMGEFFRHLKAKGLYDNSIIIVTADHGEATGELGRYAHSTIIFPEVMQVPLFIHVPKAMREGLVDDGNEVTTLTDVTPTLFYLLGHRPVKPQRFLGRPVLAYSEAELRQYPPRDEILLASDMKATYGLLTDNGRYLFTIYDSPLKLSLFDLRSDPNATNDILTDTTREQYQQRLLKELQDLGGFYHFHPLGDSTFTRKNCISSWC